MSSTSLTGDAPSLPPQSEALRLAVVGIHGYGASHVETALELQREGRATLVGLVDPVAGPVVRDGVTFDHRVERVHATVEELLDEVGVDIVAVATPLHTHAAIAAQLLEAGADVLLEKPPVTHLSDLDQLLRIEERTGRRIQVGFQSLGSAALSALQKRIDRGDLGELTSIAVYGSWTRERSYWSRASWAGRRTLDGVRVDDGAVSNPFAHALMTALRIAGWSSPPTIGTVDFDLRHVNSIEADDTSSLRISPSAIGRRTFAGTITCAFTLAGPREQDPTIVITGTTGSAHLQYTRDRLFVEGDPEPRTYGRTGLLENLLDYRQSRAELLSPLAGTGGFVDVIDRMATEQVAAVDDRFVTWNGDGTNARPELEGVEHAVREAALGQRLFREMEELPWR